MLERQYSAEHYFVLVVSTLEYFSQRRKHRLCPVHLLRTHTGLLLEQSFGEYKQKPTDVGQGQLRLVWRNLIKYLVDVLAFEKHLADLDSVLYEMA